MFLAWVRSHEQATSHAKVSLPSLVYRCNWNTGSPTFRRKASPS